VVEQKAEQPICCYRSQLNELRLNGEFVEMEIIVGSETYRVHRVIMAAKSDYLGAVMSSKLKEAKEHRVMIKDLQGNSLDSETQSHTTATDSASARCVVHVSTIHLPYLLQFFSKFPRPNGAVFIP